MQTLPMPAVPATIGGGGPQLAAGAGQSRVQGTATATYGMSLGTDDEDDGLSALSTVATPAADDFGGTGLLGRPAVSQFAYAEGLGRSVFYKCKLPKKWPKPKPPPKKKKKPEEPVSKKKKKKKPGEPLKPPVPDPCDFENDEMEEMLNEILPLAGHKYARPRKHCKLSWEFTGASVERRHYWILKWTAWFSGVPRQLGGSSRVSSQGVSGWVDVYSVLEWKYFLHVTLTWKGKDCPPPLELKLLVGTVEQKVYRGTEDFSLTVTLVDNTISPQALLGEIEDELRENYEGDSEISPQGGWKKGQPGKK